MRMSAARSRRCSPSCANCSVATPSPSRVVHHAKKGAGAIRAGQALRGSSEFHAWGDSNLYLRRDSDDRIVLTVEHRAAAAMPGVTLELAQRDDALALEPVQADRQPERYRRADFRRSAHHRRPRRRRATAAVLRTARILPRPHHHPLRAPRRHDRRRPRRQIRRRILPRRSLTDRSATAALAPHRGDPRHRQIHPNATARRATATSHFRFPHPYSRREAEAGSPSNSVIAAIKKRDPAHRFSVDLPASGAQSERCASSLAASTVSIGSCRKSSWSFRSS